MVAKGNESSRTGLPSSSKSPSRMSRDVAVSGATSKLSASGVGGWFSSGGGVTVPKATTLTVPETLAVAPVLMFRLSMF